MFHGRGAYNVSDAYRPSLPSERTPRRLTPGKEVSQPKFSRLQQTQQKWRSNAYEMRDPSTIREQLPLLLGTLGFEEGSQKEICTEPFGARRTLVLDHTTRLDETHKSGHTRVA